MQGRAGVPAKEICSKHNVLDAKIFTWHKKYWCMETKDIRHLEQLGTENAELERILADLK